MKKYPVLLLMLHAFYISAAHPGIGIVIDKKGNVYYTDLEQVWKIDLNGNKSVAVPYVHTHELYIDSNDNIFGEHVWYNGDALKTWGHYVWCLKNNGSVITVKKGTAGFLTDYSFVRDVSGNMYWVEKFTISRFQRKTPDGNIRTIAAGKFKDIRWMYVSKKEDVYFVDLHDLYKIPGEGKPELVAANLSSSTPAFSIYAPRHSVMGIWMDSHENVYLANFSGQTVKKITSGGKVSNVYYSVSPWSPTAGVFDPEGNLWLLEYALANKARAVKISKEQLLK